MNDVTREDLKEWKDELKEHFEAKLDDKLAPVVGRLEEHHVMLTGKTGRNGLVGEINQIKGSGKIAKLLAGSGAATGLISLFNSIFNK